MPRRAERLAQRARAQAEPDPRAADRACGRRSLDPRAAGADPERVGLSLGGELRRWGGGPAILPAHAPGPGDHRYFPPRHGRPDAVPQTALRPDAGRDAPADPLGALRWGDQLAGYSAAGGLYPEAVLPAGTGRRRAAGPSRDPGVA